MKGKIIARSIALVAIFSVVFSSGVRRLTGGRFDVAGNTGYLATTLVIVACIGAAMMAFDPVTYLPFLGESVLPTSVYKVGRTPKDANVSVVIPVDDKDALGIVYWAADSSVQAFSNPKDAYQSSNFDNAGVAKVQNGEAILRLRCPGLYKVWNRTLDRHVHYRIVSKDGLMSRVLTRPIVCL
jgi:hypothetical protein